MLFCLVRKDEDADYFTELNKKIFFFLNTGRKQPSAMKPNLQTYEILRTASLKARIYNIWREDFGFGILSGRCAQFKSTFGIKICGKRHPCKSESTYPKLQKLRDWAWDEVGVRLERSHLAISLREAL